MNGCKCHKTSNLKFNFLHIHILAYFSSDEIDSIISEYLFKLAEQDPAQARKDTMLGFVELR